MLRERYKDTVTIEYIDAGEPEKLAAYPKLKELSNKGGIRLPIVAFDGEPAWAGAVSFPHIVQELQQRGVKPPA
ncbi:MAG: hypothetical protein ACOY4Q_00975 [Bacillota bacterium]